MSGLHMWAPRFLFLWQLLWLQVQAAPIPEVAMDSILLTSMPLGPTKPWSWDQQNPAHLELSSVNHEVSAVLAEAPEETEPSPKPQEALVQLPRQQEAATQPAVSSEPLKFLLDHHGDQDKQQPYGEYVHSSKRSILPSVPLEEIKNSHIHQAQQPTFPPVDLGLTITPEHTSGAASTALQQTAAPPKPSEVTFPPQVLVQAQWPSISPVDLGLTITPEHTSGAAASALQQTAAPPTPSEVTFQQEAPVQAQWPTIPPMDLGLTITPDHTSGAAATALQQTAALPKPSEVTFPPQVLVQAQWPSISPVHLGLTITPEHTSGAAATALKQNAAPPKSSEVTFPQEAPVQAPQPTFLAVDLELTITPESTVETGATALQQTTAPEKHPEVTLPPPDTVQAHQPTFPPLDLEITITPEPNLEADVTALQQTTAPAKHPEVTLEHPELQPTESSETVPPMTEQSATMNICELCSCSNGTLSCIGFGSKQRLNRVPVPEPSTYNGTFTIL
ncbi:leucine-rich repeat-containing protein 37A-like [Myotis lucifugus]|uniref:leucine-rich repeat-containing protein 37A-like n=1 Tax=Myotis lucifugus TaxID=59463 RepID=UPI000CCBF39E|nr:leucine-rich repeat-containing protein 37A-like [Myotis lucifugus]